MTHNTLRHLIREILKEDMVPTSPTVNIGDVSQSFIPVTTPNLAALGVAGAFASAYPYLVEYMNTDCIVSEPLYPVVGTELEFKKYTAAKAVGDTNASTKLISYQVKVNEEVAELTETSSFTGQYALIEAGMQTWPQKKTWNELEESKRDEIGNWVAIMLTRTCVSDADPTTAEVSEKDRVKSMIEEKLQTRDAFVKFIDDFAKSAHDTTNKILKEHQAEFAKSLSDANVSAANTAATNALRDEDAAYKRVKAFIK